MRILVTGSSGQIGTNLALACLERGHEVLGVDLRPNQWTTRFTTRLADLTQPLAPGSLGTPEVIVHLAAHAKVHELVEHPLKALENVMMTQRALELAREVGACFVFASSREVYGETVRPSTDEACADRSTVASTYAASKLSGEAMVDAYARCYGLRALTFRFSNVYGRYDDDLERMERVVPLFLDRISRGQEVTVYGPQKVLDFTYVDDCVVGIVRGLEALQAGALRHETINLSSGVGVALGTLAAMVGEVVGQRPSIVQRPSRVGEITHYVADLSKARLLLGFEPHVSLAEGLRRVVARKREVRELVRDRR